MNQAKFSFSDQLILDSTLPDGMARLESVDPCHSFIVQAPAGSGKTSLLTQRFLALLSQVESPEQIVAMTFTQKAAAEMQERILLALKAGLEALASDASIYQQNSWQLAQMVLQRDQQQQWQLLSNPQRLRIRTIDALNAYLVHQMPLLSKMGAQATVAERPEELYKKAARATLQETSVADQVSSIFKLVNGNFARAESLLVSMLAKRDQWMPLITGIKGSEIEKHQFDVSLMVLVKETFINHLEALRPVLHLLEEARLNAVCIANTHSPELQPLKTLDIKMLFEEKGAVDLNTVENWRLLSRFVLTKSGSFKKRLTKNDGFPGKTAEEKSQKEEMQSCLNALAKSDETGEMVKSLAAMNNLPLPEYDEAKWEQLLHLMSLLNTAAAHLKLVFAEAGQTDFIEIAQSASHSLGSELHPTELAQRLDYQIQHLLIDEFQDTSVSQFELVKKLVSGWSPEDNHTLFIVGDPMQSIYRFREAEVGNFLEAWQGQLGPVSLKQKRLTVNFRSQQGIVDWVNETFRTVFPAESRIEKGAVTYSDSIAINFSSEKAVFRHWKMNQSAYDEASSIADIVFNRLKKIEEGEVVGILGRSRSHLAEIAMLLKKKGVAYKAVELETLSERQEIQDCVALTRALLHMGDRPAWLAVLRFPTVALSLEECHILLGDPSEFKQPVWQLIQKHFSRLSVETQKHFSKSTDVIARALSQFGELSLSQLVSETWLAMDMAQSLESEAALENVEAFWQMLAELEQASPTVSKKELEEAVDKLFALADDSIESQKVELMTMHKSKGLEFDTVILPGLGRQTRADDKPLLNWIGFRHEGHDQLVMAPLDQKGGETSALVSLIQNLEKEKQAYETGRLLYVAATRAKQQLHLFGSVSVTEKQLEQEEVFFKPAESSLLASLWPSQKLDFYSLVSEIDFEVVNEEKPVVVTKVARLPKTRVYFEERLATQDKQNVKESMAITTPTESDKTTSPSQALFATAVGNLVHAVLEQMVSMDLDSVNKQFIEMQSDGYRQWLYEAGLRDRELNEGVDRVKASLSNVLEHAKARWALDSCHQQSEVELELLSYGLNFGDRENGITHHIIDRTFVFEGKRWIIDYKTSYWHESMSESKQIFIDKQVETYRNQLNRYGELFLQLENLPQKKVLFFTHLGEWVEMD